MKTPTAIAPATVQDVIDLINSGIFADWDLYTFTLFGGGVLRLTTANFDITDGTHTWTSASALIDSKRSRALAHWRVGLDTDTLSVIVMPRPFHPITRAEFPDKIGSVPWIQAAQGGALDNADVQVDRAFFAAPPTYPLPAGGAATPKGLITVFAGMVAEVDTSNTIVAITINDYRQLLTISMPKHVYQGGCRHTLFDVGCNNAGANPPATFAKAGLIGAGSSGGTIIAPALAMPTGSGTYALGRIVMTSGDNDTFQRTISDWDAFTRTLSLVNPFPFDLAVGDTFTIYPGCNKQYATCALFGSALNGNQDNYGGQQFIPDAATAL